ncbi:MAG: PAS domain S-box protein [Methanoregula sp.]
MIHVLYVDEDPALLDSARMILAESGEIVVDTSLSAHAALEMLGQTHYDAIVSDFQLPDMGAPAFLEKIQVLAPGLPLFVFFDDNRTTTIPDVRNLEDMPGQKKARQRLLPFDRLRKNLLKITEKHRRTEHYRQIIENTYEAVVVVLDNRIVFTNMAFGKILGGYSPEEMEGHAVLDFADSRDHERITRCIRDQLTSTVSCREDTFRVLARGGDVRYLKCRESVISWEGHPAVLAFVTDVTDRRQTEMALDLTNRKICILNDLTRHDIANRLTVLRGRLKIARNLAKDPQLIRELDIVENAGRDIYGYLETAHTYHDLGMTSTCWFKLDSVLNCQKILSDAPELKIFLDARDIEVYCDPLFPRVFENLIDNSLRHGNHVSEIRITTGETDNGLVITVEDDGSGIPGEDKERIFEHGVGKHPGLGLFLSREILSITGISIRETGSAGSGARFEITIPPGGYRFTGTRQGLGLPCT